MYTLIVVTYLFHLLLFALSFSSNNKFLQFNCFASFLEMVLMASASTSAAGAGGVGAGAYSSSASCSPQKAIESKQSPCFTCKKEESELKPAWKMSSGLFAMLCTFCALHYERGTFCTFYHSKYEGWRDCVLCKKKLHCGCIASAHLYLLADVGGIECTDCVGNEIDRSTETKTPAELSTKCKEPVTGNAGPLQICAPPLALSAPPQHCLLGSQIAEESNPNVIFLFHKVLSARDANALLGILVIPKSCAEAYFPEIAESQQIPIRFLDKERREWEFRYCFYPNRTRGKYTLEGTGSFLASTDAKAYDRVNFSIEEPEGRLIIGVSKSPPRYYEDSTGSSSSSPNWSTSSSENQSMSSWIPFAGILGNM